MAYTGDPANVPADAVRLLINDVDPTLPFLSDDEIAYFLSRNNNSINKAAVEAARIVLFKLASYVRERVDVLDYYGGQYFQQYKEALNLFIKDPNYNVALQGAMPYAGGISITDIRANIETLDNNIVPVEKGIPTEGLGAYVNNNSPFYVNNTTRDDAFDL